MAEESSRSSVGRPSQGQVVTPEEIAPFLGNWLGTMEEVYADKSLSTTSEIRPALLSIKMVSEKPMVAWALGAGTGGTTWHDSTTYRAPSLGRYPAKFGKQGGVVFLEFTTRYGNNYRFIIKEQQLVGRHTSAGVSVLCTLSAASREEQFTDAALSRYEVTYN